MPPKMLQAAALGGLFTGILSALPVVNVANCCCLWVMGGGFLAAYLLQQDQPFRITVLDGLLVGLLAGAIGALVGTVVGIPINAMMAPFQQQIMRTVMQNSDIPPEVREMFDGMSGAPTLMLGAALGFMISLVINAIFAPIGGMLFVLFSKRPQAPPPTPPPPASPPIQGWTAPPPPPAQS